MPGLILHTSNQLDFLARRLSEVVAAPLDSPFTPEIVVVQSLASRRWLSFQIAQDQKICANYAFPFIADFIGWSVKIGSPPDAPIEKVSSEFFTWKIDSLLRRCLEEKEFARVAKYLRDGDSMKRFHLASKIAHLFDQYRVYRPEMVASWTTSKKKLSGDEAWQAALWRKLGDAPGFDQAFARLRTNGFREAGQLDLPERLSIFAPASLPPAYIDLLFHLSRVREVHLFLLRSSREYRGDDPTKKQRARLGLSPSEQTTGNPLFTSWGKIDADLTDLLLEKEERLDVPIITGSEEFLEFEEETLLGKLKGDILASHNRGSNSGENLPASAPVRPNDRSLTIHASYSAMREVEALYDQLLDCLETMPGLRPRDVLVVSPEIEKYAPLIQAVFGYPEDDSIRIPYSLADRHPRSESLPIDTFLTLLELPDSRYTASEVFALLGSRAFRRRFHFNDDDLSLIRDWIEGTVIRWGIDADHRKRMDLPALDANTWRHGLNRLVLGYAMPGENKDLFEGILPHDEVEGEGAEVLGRLLSATGALFQLEKKFGHPQPLANWAEPLTEIVDQFLDPADEEEVRDVRFLRLIIEKLRTLGDGMGAEAPVDFRVLREYLGQEIARMEQRGNFFTGGVTFCAIKPVRGIPARVVCLLGINDQVFPRRPQPAQFDLMARSPEPGDSSAGQDDRCSFLETLLSARERLLISYVGRSAVNNQEIPPSVIVSELLDYLNQAFVFPDNKSAKRFLVTEHPLHPFSPRYFNSKSGEDYLFSFSKANAEASRGIAKVGEKKIAPFITGPLPEEGEPVRNLELRELIDFWKHPCKYFLKRRVGLTLGKTGLCLDDDEPFQPTPLELYPIRQDLLTEELESGKMPPFKVVEARGILQPGVIGEIQLGSIRAEIQALSKTIQEKIDHGKKDEAVSIDLDLEGYTVSGKIDTLYGGRNIHFRPANLSPKDYLRAWIEHLALGVEYENGAETQTILIGRDAVTTFELVSSPRGELRTLCDLFLEGLTRPLPFFPATSMAFVETELSGKGAPFKKAREKWDPFWYKNEKREREKDDVFIKRCFDKDDPLDDYFAEIARLVFKTMLQHVNRKEL